MINCLKISAEQTIPIRQIVLRPGKNVETCHFDGDNDLNTQHFGIFENDKLVGVLSLYKKNNATFKDQLQYQIRGMAVLPGYQKQGFGQQLVAAAELYATKVDADLIWFNARQSAVGFYEKLGYTPIGDVFEIPDVGPHYIMSKYIRTKNPA